MDKGWKEVIRKLDLLLSNAGIEDPGPEKTPLRPFSTRPLTPQEQQAIDNAPKAEATIPTTPPGPRTTAVTAPATPAATVEDTKTTDDTTASRGRK